MPTMSLFCTTAEAARVLRIGEATVRKWANLGRLPVQRTASGVRLFDRAQLEQLAAARASKAK
jgi:excisionase family DNA binding protein